LNGLDAFASFNYCFPINSLIYNIKFRGGVGLAQLLGRLMAKHCPMPETDGFVVCPVPVSYRRHVERSFNQTWVLGQAIATQLELPIEANGLLRARHTPPQRGNRRALRLHNVKGAFVGTEAVRGQRVLVIDDVLTTGATAFAASSALKRAGAREVLVWACAAVN
jgi:ComF family protein